MPSTAIRQNNIGGLMPSVHNAQSGAIRVVRGRNFRWHFDGPYSGFGNKLVSQQLPLSDYPYYGLFTLDDQSILCTVNGIYQQNCETECWELVKSLTPATNLECQEHDYPWSSAFVGDDYFFSHPLVGIIRFERCSASWSCVRLDSCSGDTGSDNTRAASTEPRFYDFESVSCIESNPVFGIAEAGNRLIVLSRDTVGHSEIDNGTNLECDPFCGGGFVSSSIAQYGFPLGVRKTFNGFVVFTSNGVIQASNIQSIAGFNYRPISRNTFPVNPWAIADFNEGYDTVFLSKSGLVIAALNRETIVLSPIEVEMSSWLCEKELPRNDYLNNQHAVMLSYSAETKELFVSLCAHSKQNAPYHVYTRALVFNVKYQKWSTFDQPHYALGPVNGTFHRMNGYTLGFYGLDESLHWFNEVAFNSYRDAKGAAQTASLDSYIELGPFAIGSEDKLDTESEIQEIKLYTEAAKPIYTINNYAKDEKLAVTDDNYQDQLAVEFKADVYIYSSMDAYSRVNTEDAFSAVLSYSTDFVKTYSCQSSSLYHSVVIEANGVSEFYAIKRVDVKLLANGTTA